MSLCRKCGGKLQKANYCERCGPQSGPRVDMQSLIKKACADFDALPGHEQREIRRQQREGYVRAEMSWPKPKYQLVDGVKVYESLEDYYND